MPKQPCSRINEVRGNVPAEKDEHNYLDNSDRTKVGEGCYRVYSTADKDKVFWVAKSPCWANWTRRLQRPSRGPGFELSCFFYAFCVLQPLGIQTVELGTFPTVCVYMYTYDKTEYIQKFNKFSHCTSPPGPQRLPQPTPIHPDPHCICSNTHDIVERFFPPRRVPRMYNCTTS